jgi:hypothetical protein
VVDSGVARKLELVGMHRILRQRGDRQRGDEFLGVLGQATTHVGALFAQAADQVQTFVGGDAARDDQENLFAVQHVFNPEESTAPECGYWTGDGK